MTKNIRILKINLWSILLITPVFFMLPAFITSCNSEDSIQSVRIDSVWTNQLDVTTSTETSSYTGLWIRVQGSGFSGLKEIICNDTIVSFVSTLQTDKYLTFKIPSTLPTGDAVADSVRNTIRVVTNHGEATYSNFIFKDKSKQPSITSVSYTMPKVGDYIYITGKYLGTTTEVDFPTATGWVQAADFSIISNTQVKVKVPDGAGTAGAIKIVADGDTYFSPAYMFGTDGIFIHSFKEPSVIISTGSVNYYDSSHLQTLTSLTSNPDSALAIPTTAGSVPTSTGWAGFFKFYADVAFQNIINKGGSITGSSALSSLAIQFDIYVNQPWTSGVLALRMNKNLGGVNSSYIYNIEPWTTSVPYTFEDGWRTITVPFSSFSGLTMGTLSSYISTIKSNAYQSLLGFTNQDVNADGHTATSLTNFQMYISNIRLVSTAVPTE